MTKKREVPAKLKAGPGGYHCSCCRPMAYRLVKATTQRNMRHKRKVAAKRERYNDENYE